MRTEASIVIQHYKNYFLGEYSTLAKIKNRTSSKRNINCKTCSKPMYLYPYQIGKTKYCSFSCRNRDFTGKKAFRWKGGKRLHAEGYILTYAPNHPNKHRQNCVLEHRLVMEKHLGRYLKRSERVHHINHIKTDNRIKNLILFKNESEHQIYHAGDQLRKCH